MNYYDVINKSIKIVNELGHSVYTDGYYSDTYLYNEYEFDKLRITYCNNKYIQIYIDNIELLYYDFNNKNIKYKTIYPK